MNIDGIAAVGFAAAALTTAAYLPQALKVIRTRHTADLSVWMYILMTGGVFSWMVYGIFRRDPVIILANGVTFLLSGTILVLKIKNG